MKEPRFIELLNLYVDQQLSAQEAAELEAEIEENPARRRTYQQYCRMQKACAQLFEHERSAAPASIALARALADADRKIAYPQYESRRPARAFGFSFAAVAAAACVAVAVMLQKGPMDSPHGSGLATTEPQVPATGEFSSGVASVENVPNASGGEAVPEFKPVFAVSAPQASDVFSVAMSQEETRLLEWTHQVQLKPVQKIPAEAFAFGAKPTGAGANAAMTAPRFILTDAAEETPVEPTAAFTFTK